MSKKNKQPNPIQNKPQATQKAKGPKLPLKTRFINFFKEKKAFFITEPIASLKNEEYKNTWWNGQHPMYRLIFASLVFLAFIIIPTLSFDYGITWDEFEDIAYFNEVLAYYTSFGSDKRCLDIAGTLPGHEVKTALIPHLVNYGPFVNLSSAFAYKFLSPFGLYETRHLVVSLFACIGLMFTGLLAKRLGNWQTGVLAFLFILLTPTIFGHGMNNQKDIPFLAFYVASLYFIVKFLEEMPAPTRGTWIKLAISMGILMSIRVGGLLVFAYLLLFAGLLFFWNVYTKKLAFDGKNIWLYFKKLFKPVALGYFVGVIFWPAAIADPLKHPFEALKNFEKFSLVHIYEIFEGKKYYMKDFPWYYEPKSMLITIPLFVLAGYVIALILSAINFKKIKAWHIGVLMFATVFPIFYVIYKKSALYSSWRHLLFIYPTVVVMAAIGWQSLMHLIKSKYMRWIPVAILVLLVGKVGAWMIKNHPYQYVYYNETVGGVKGAYGYYETDYWCQSPRAAMEWLLENEKLKDTKKRVYVASNNESHSMSYYSDKVTGVNDIRVAAQKELSLLTDELYEGSISKEVYATKKAELDKKTAAQIDKLEKVTMVWTRDFEWEESYWDYAIFTSRTLSHEQMTNGYYPVKGTIHKIMVDGIPLAAIVKRENFDFYNGHKLKSKNQLDSALPFYQKAALYNPINEGPYREMGYIKMVQNKLDEAIPYLKKSIKLCPENYYSYAFLGYIYQQKKMVDSSEFCFKKSIEYKENLSNAWEGLGSIYLDKNDPMAAKKNFLRAAELGNRGVYLFFNLGRAYELLNYTDSALLYYNEATQINPNFPYPYMAMGLILQKQGNPQAQQYLAKARALGLQ